MLAGFFAVSLIAQSSPAEDQGDKTPDQPETHKVEIEDITLTVPESWEQKPPENNLRLAQFDLPKPNGVEDNAELVVYAFGGAAGGLKQNLPRWLNEFQSQGRQVKIFRGKSPQGEYALVDIRGTHLGPSFRRRDEPLPDARMISVVLAVEDKANYFLKTVGPEKTINAVADDVRTAFGGDAEKEEEVELNGGR